MYTNIWIENLREADYFWCGCKDAIKIDFIEVIWKVILLYTSAQFRDYCLYLNVIYNIKLTTYEYNSYTLVKTPSLTFFLLQYL
jgi:hypothetical protein